MSAVAPANQQGLALGDGVVGDEAVGEHVGTALELLGFLRCLRADDLDPLAALVDHLGARNAAFLDDLLQLLVRYLVGLRRVEVSPAQESHARGLQHAIDLPQALSDVGDEGQRAAADDHVGIVVLEGQLLRIAGHEAEAILQSGLADPLFEQGLHIGIDVQADDLELRPFGKFDVEIARSAADVDTDSLADSPDLAEHPHGGHGIRVLDPIFGDPLECLGVRLARGDRKARLRLRPEPMARRSADKADELGRVGVIGQHGRPNRLAGWVLPGDSRGPGEFAHG